MSLASVVFQRFNNSSALLVGYGGWQGQSRREHRARVLARLNWRLCAAGERKLLNEFLLARAIEPRRLLNVDSNSRTVVEQRV